MSITPSRPVLKLTIVLVALAFKLSPAAAKKNPATTLRWTEGNAGSTFSPDTDGKYRYGLWTADVGIVLAIAAQELKLCNRRGERSFGAPLTEHNPINAALAVRANQGAV